MKLMVWLNCSRHRFLVLQDNLEGEPEMENTDHEAEEEVSGI